MAISGGRTYGKSLPIVHTIAIFSGLVNMPEQLPDLTINELLDIMAGILERQDYYKTHSRK